jgi:uncharacterized protein
MRKSVNVLGGPLEPCSTDPMTGYFRDGCCHTDEQDRGGHTVCARMTLKFLDFTRARGNDLVTPQPAHGFPGLRPGDQWCVCALRWEEARRAGAAPPVVLSATHHKALDIISIEDLSAHGT